MRAGQSTARGLERADHGNRRPSGMPPGAAPHHRAAGLGYPLAVLVVSATPLTVCIACCLVLAPAAGSVAADRDARVITPARVSHLAGPVARAVVRLAGRAGDSREPALAAGFLRAARVDLRSGPAAESLDRLLRDRAARSPHARFRVRAARGFQHYAPRPRCHHRHRRWIRRRARRARRGASARATPSSWPRRGQRHRVGEDS